MSGGYKTCLIHAVGGVYDPFLSVDSRGEVQVYLYTVQENEGGGGDDDTSKLGQRGLFVGLGVCLGVSSRCHKRNQPRPRFCVASTGIRLLWGLACSRQPLLYGDVMFACASLTFTDWGEGE